MKLRQDKFLSQPQKNIYLIVINVKKYNFGLQKIKKIQDIYFKEIVINTGLIVKNVILNLKVFYII